MKWRTSLLFFALVSAAASAQSGKSQVEFRNSAEISPPPGYSHAVVVGGGKMIFLSGQVGLNRPGEMVGKEDFMAQACRCLRI